MTNASTDGAAYDAAIYSDEPQQVGSVREQKILGAVDYFGREVAKAESDIEKLEQKVAKLEERLADAKAAVETKKEELDLLTAELDSVRSQA